MPVMPASFDKTLNFDTLCHYYDHQQNHRFNIGYLMLDKGIFDDFQDAGRATSGDLYKVVGSIQDWCPFFWFIK